MEFIEKLNAYYKQNIKYAFMNVFCNIKGNLCLFIVIFIFQYLFVITLSYLGKHHKGYVGHVVEDFHGEGNSVITDYSYESNNEIHADFVTSDDGKLK